MSTATSNQIKPMRTIFQVLMHLHIFNIIDKIDCMKSLNKYYTIVIKYFITEHTQNTNYDKGGFG